MRCIHNIDIATYKTRNSFEFPELDAVTDIPKDIIWMSFTDALTPYFGTKRNVGIHFFQDDYKFDVVWNQPDKYIPLFKECACVLQPDFSLYWDAPMPVQMFNKYKSHWCARYWQDHGVKVIPCVNLSSQDHWYWTLLGYPCNSILATSTIGANQSKFEKDYTDKKIAFIHNNLDPLDLKIFTRSKPNIAGAEIIPLPYKGRMNDGTRQSQ